MAAYQLGNIRAQQKGDVSTEIAPAVALNKRLRKVQEGIEKFDPEKFPDRTDSANDVYNGLHSLFAELTDCCAKRVDKGNQAEIFMPMASVEGRDETTQHSRDFIATVLGEKEYLSRCFPLLRSSGSVLFLLTVLLQLNSALQHTVGLCRILGE